MSITCKVFGHKPPGLAPKVFPYPGNTYADIRETVEDGIGRKHAEVIGTCVRCDERFLVARVHLPR
jgi:hypothetical protein